MFFVFSKLLNFFTCPINWIIGLFILFFIFKRKQYRRLLLFFSIIVALIFTNGQLNTLAVRAWSKPYLYNSLNDSVYEFAIVLGGSTDYNPELNQVDYNEKGDRMTEAIRLYRLGRVKKLYLSGESAFNFENGKSNAMLFLHYMKELGVNPKDIILEQEARTTSENIRNLKALISHQRNSSCLLITSGWHMRRALKGFSKSGLNIMPYSVDMPKPLDKGEWYSYLPSWRAAIAWQELIHEIVGMAVINF